MGKLYNVGRGHYTLDNFRFFYDPLKPKHEGQFVKLSQVKIKMLTDTIFQTWESSISDEEQEFRWNILPLDFWNELKSRFDEHLTDGGVTHELIFHNKSPEETWTILINSLQGVLGKGYSTYENVRLRFTLIDQVS